MEIERYINMKPTQGVLPELNTQFAIEDCKKYDMGDNTKYKLFLKDINSPSRWAMWLNGMNLDKLIMSIGTETKDWVGHTVKLETKEVTIKATGDKVTAMEIVAVE